MVGCLVLFAVVIRYLDSRSKELVIVRVKSCRELPPR